MRVSLHLATSFDAAWEHVLLPWFEKVALQAFEQTAPVAVVTPFRSHAQLLRGKLLAHGISLLGVRFLVPAQLRELFAARQWVEASVARTFAFAPRDRGRRIRRKY